MAHNPSCISSARALLRVLCGNRPLATLQSPPSHKAWLPRSPSLSPSRHVSATRQQQSKVLQSKTKSRDLFPDLIRDDKIKAPNVQMPMPEGGLGPVEPLNIALARVKPGVEHLVQLSEADDGKLAICRISTVADLLQRRSEREQHQKLHKRSQKQSVPKQIELNWAIGAHDLSHKLTQLKSFIDDGKKVEVVLATKKRQRKANPEEGRVVLDRIRQKLDEADGREVKPMTGGEVGTHTVLTLRKKGLE